MNLPILKLIVILSGLIGFILGFLSLLPYIGGVMFFILLSFTSLIVILMLDRAKVLEISSIQESVVIGSVVGFLSYIAFSIVYLPCVWILSKVFNYYTNYGIALALNNSNLFVIIVVSMFVAVLSATLNGFVGFVTYYLSEVFRNMNSNK